MGTTGLAQEVRALSFETWLTNHDEAHQARWCRELYPWEVFSCADYRDAAVGRPQDIAGYDLTVTRKTPGKVAGRTAMRVRLETASDSRSATWRSGSWADDFVLVAADDGYFVTLFTERKDPAQDALMDFMSGRFDRLDAKRCLPWSALLFRTLVAELAAPLGLWDRGLAFDVEPSPVRAGYRLHPQFRPHGRALRPLLAEGRSAWVMYAFSEDKAHRQALYCEGQCERLLVAYCHPTLTQHHRSKSSATAVLSLFELAKKSRLAGKFLPQIRFLTNHMRMAASAVSFSASVEEATAVLSDAQGPQEISTSELREARSALGMEVCTLGDAAYAFASANLLNAATNRRAGLYQGSQKLPKEVYAFKQRVGQWIEGLVDEPIANVAVYVPPKGSTDTAVYVRVGGVQFSFHAIPRTGKLNAYAMSSMNVVQSWSGRRLQPVAPFVLAWGRALFRAEAE